MLSHWAAESNSSPADVQAAVRDSCFAVWHAGSWLTGARGTVRQLAMRGLMGMGMESTWGTMRRIRSCRKPSGAACAPELQVWLLMCAQTHEWMRMTTLICCIDKLLALMQPCLPDGTVLRQHLQLTSTRSQRAQHQHTPAVCATGIADRLAFHPAVSRSKHSLLGQLQSYRAADAHMLCRDPSQSGRWR